MSVKVGDLNVEFVISQERAKSGIGVKNGDARLNLSVRNDIPLGRFSKGGDDIPHKRLVGHDEKTVARGEGIFCLHAHGNSTFASTSRKRRT